MNKVKIGITGTGSLIGQAIIKSVKASDLAGSVSMVGFDYFDSTIGSFWVDTNYLLPDILKNAAIAESWLEKIIEIIFSEKVKILFIGLDFELEFFSKYKNIIESKTECKIMVSDHDVIKIADDKYLTYKFLKGNGFNYPKTWLPEELKGEEIDFPCFVKPRKGSRSRDVYIAENKVQLDVILPKVNNPIVQELIGNPNVEYTCGVIRLDNESKETIVLRRDLKDGNTETAYFSKDTPKIIYDYINKVATKLKPYGACNFQLRLDDSGVPKIFEINTRHSGTTYIRALFGFNEVEYILSCLLGRKIKDFNLKEGIVKRYYDEVFIGS